MEERGRTGKDTSSWGWGGERGSERRRVIRSAERREEGNREKWRE